MVNGALLKSVSPPAHSMVPSPLLGSPPAQMPILMRMGVCGKLEPPTASAYWRVRTELPSTYQTMEAEVQTTEYVWTEVWGLFTLIKVARS